MPVVQLLLSFDAGNAADSKAKPGTQALVLGLAEEATTRRTAQQIAEQQERLGAYIGEAAGMDRTRYSLDALTPNLAESLDLFADIVRNPAFAPADLARVRSQLLTRIAQEARDPDSIASRQLPALIYGQGHPYAVPFTGSGTAAGVTAVTRDDLVAFHQRWIRPDNARLFAVGDTPLAALRPMRAAGFANGAPPPAVDKGVKTFPPAAPQAAGRIVLIDRPGSPQSLILAGAPLSVQGTDNPLPLFAANDILGGSFLSRLNTDLRETKGWAYGVSTSLGGVAGPIPLFLSAPVQTSRTGAAIAAAIADIDAFRGDRPATAAELARSVGNTVRSLPGDFESAGAVLGAIERNFVLHRPDDYQRTLTRRYQALTLADVAAATAASLDARRFVWVVIGDRAKVEPQLTTLGLPVEVRAAE